MGDRTAIAWTDATWNPVRGCSIVSPGCTHCYAMKQAARFPAYAGLTKPSKGGPVWTGEVRLVPEKLHEPLRWRKPRRVFVNSMSDLFHEGVPVDFIASVFAMMGAAARHTFQVLTKRPDRMRLWVDRWQDRRERGRLIELGSMRHGGILHDPGPVVPNVWLGVSCEDQARADERIPLLLSTPAAVRFVSAEPLLGPIDFRPRPRSDICIRCGEGPDARHDHADGYRTRGLDWIIVGGESGPGARPCDVSWVRSIVAQCRAAGVACFVKQLGSRTLGPKEWAQGGWCSHPDPDGSYERTLRDPKGGDHAEWPDDLRVREWPRP